MEEGEKSLIYRRRRSEKERNGKEEKWNWITPQKKRNRERRK